MSSICHHCGHESPDIAEEPSLYSVIRDRDGDTWQRREGGWFFVGSEIGCSWESLVDELSPIKVIHDTSKESA